jgi:hypothetical protein
MKTWICWYSGLILRMSFNLKKQVNKNGHREERREKKGVMA